MTLNVSRLKIAGWLIVSALLLCGTAHAEVPHLIRYQGTAIDSNEVPLEGPYTLTFRFYDAQTEGTTLWEETQVDVPVTGGRFSVLLGQITPLTVMDWNEPCWLSIQISAEPELAPRQRITSVPLAITAERLADSDQISPHNLLVNGSFESWLGGSIGADPDAWNNTGSADRSRDATAGNVTHGEASYKLVNHTENNPSVVMQHALTISAIQNTWARGRTFTFGCWVKTNTASRVRVAITDNIGTTNSSFHTGGNTFEFLTVTRTLDSMATQLTAIMETMTGSPITTNIDGAILVEGAAPTAFSPHPTDLARASSVRVYNSYNTPLPSSGPWEPLVFDSERWDTDDIHDTASQTSRLTCKIPGTYLILANISIESHPNGDRAVTIRVNGTTDILVHRVQANASSHTDLAVSTVYDLEIGDYVEVIASQTGFNGLAVETHPDWSPEFGMVKLR